MSKFRAGDKVRNKESGVIDTVENAPGGYEYDSACYIDAEQGVWLESSRWEYQRNWELVTSNGDKPMARRTFKLVKATPTHKAGTLFQEQCEDGTQPYSPMTEPGYLDNYTIADRSKVEDQPQWFAEVFKVTPEYMTQAELDQWDAFKKGQKPAKRTYTKRAKVAKK